VDIQFGPGGDLFYADILAGKIKRIHYAAGNQAPKAVATATPSSGDVPLPVVLDASGSSDPDGESLTYAWDTDGDGQYDDSTTAVTEWTYTTAGTYPVGLKVTDPSGASATDVLAVTVGNTPPTASITSPSPGVLWKVGDLIAFTGSATDVQDGDLAPAQLTWSLALRHCPSNCHSHQLLSFPNTDHDSFNAPDHEYPSYLELTLTATDSGGLTDTRTLRLDPATVDLSLRSSPTGLKLAVNGQEKTTPFVCTVIQGSANTLSATASQTLAAKTYDFGSWSDGGLATHTVTANAAGTYTATYTQR
jgi:PKD repeat protein